MSERAFHTTGYITPAQPRTNDVARAIVEAADMNDRVLVAIDAEFASPAQQPWKYTPPAQERIQALELEVRQLTEQIARLRHAPAPQADSQPAPVMEDTPPPCDQELFDQGVSVGLFDIPKWTAEELCRGIAAATEARVDWHYLGGHVHIKALPAARAPADSVMEDAARYQWIRGPGEESTRYSRWNIEYWDGPNGWQPMQRESMDSAIDAARAQQKAGE